MKTNITQSPKSFSFKASVNKLKPALKSYIINTLLSFSQISSLRKFSCVKM